MASQRQVKRCPKCGAMTFLETEQCFHCGHQFQTDVLAQAPSFNPERTQTLTLPPMFSRTADPQAVAQAEDEIAFFEPTMPRRKSAFPLVIIVAMVILLLAAFVWLLSH